MGEYFSYSDLLFARPSFAEGVGRLLDFGDTLTDFNRSPSAAIADATALSSDWYAVGADLKAVMAAQGAADEQKESAE